MPLTLGISLGDVTGIGPEVTLKALAAELPFDDTRYLVVGDPVILQETNRSLGSSIPLAPANQADPSTRVLVQTTPGVAVRTGLPAGAPEAARAALAWLRTAASLCLAGRLDALVTAPLSKEAILRTGEPFVGQTELLTSLAGHPRTTMMLLGADDRRRWLRVALATTHVPIRRVADTLTRENILTAIQLAAQACRDLGLKRARIAVCGLNPHAGEGGHLGEEELTLIGPAVAQARQLGLDVTGPLAGDTVFHLACRGDFEVVVAMYHDQGLAPLKLLAFDNGVNWTLGLPFIRTSPDHGTAYDIAGRGVANPSSMRAAIALARQLARHLPTLPMQSSPSTVP